MLKQDLRTIYRDKRRAITAHEKDRLEDLMLIRFQEAGFPVPATLMTYIPFTRENEYDPELIIRYGRFQNPDLRLCCPAILPKENLMDAVYWDDDTVFAPNKMGILEVVNGERVKEVEIDMVLMPLLAFDEKGTRVGYGKGYYDRFLSERCPDALRIGFSFFEAVHVVEDVHAYDMPLNFCITPNQIYSFNH